MLSASFHVACDSCLVQVTQVLRHQHGEWLADHLFAGVPEDSFRRGIDYEYRAVGIDRNDRIRGGIGHSTIMLFTFTKRCFVSLTLDYLFGTRHDPTIFRLSGNGWGIQLGLPYDTGLGG